MAGLFARSPFLRSWRQRLGGGPYLVLVYAVLGLWTAVALFGFAWVVLTSLKTNRELFTIGSIWGWPAEFQWGNYARAWTRARMGRFFFNSVLVSAVSVLLIDLVGAMAAYVLARFRFAGNRLVLGGFILGSAIPLQLLAVPLYLISTTGAYSTRWSGSVWSISPCPCPLR